MVRGYPAQQQRVFSFLLPIFREPYMVIILAWMTFHSPHFQHLLILFRHPCQTAQTLCANNAITNIVYSACSSTSSPTVTGFPAGVTGSFNGVYFTISGTPTVGGNYAYTITTTGSCQPSSARGTITVQAQGITLSSGSSSPTVCTNSPVNMGYTLSGTATGAHKLV